jgi:hypothetical protein
VYPEVTLSPLQEERTNDTMEVEDYDNRIMNSAVAVVNQNGSSNNYYQSVAQAMMGRRDTAAATTTTTTMKKNELDFTSTIEKIVSSLEQRGDNHNPHHGPLNDSEISKLSMLCSQQTEHLRRSITHRNKHHQQHQKNENHNTTTDETTQQSHMFNTTDDDDDIDLGFANVDADVMGELVEYLEKHVALASGIDLIQSSYKIIHALKEEGSSSSQKEGQQQQQRNIDEVR